MKDLHNYTSALQDVGLDSTPVRNDDGEYRWSNGQLEILNQPAFNEIRLNQLRIEQTDNSVRAVSGEILAYEVPIQALEKEGNELLDLDQDAIDDQKLQLDQFKSLLNQLDRDMLVRGYIPPDDSEPEVSNEPVVEKPTKRPKVNAREIFGFLSIWLIGEVFMTYVQWNALRDGKGIEDMVVRSISLGVVLFLIHLVGRNYKRDHRSVQLIFLVFSFLMLFTMLLGPLVLREAYPPTELTDSASVQWSIQTDNSENMQDQQVSDPYPFWVSFYRNNDMLPGIFVFLFFVIMQTFGRFRQKQEKVVIDEKPSLPEFRPSEGKSQIEERRQYYLQQISLGEKRLKKLAMKQSETVAPNTNRLHEIFDELKSRQEEMKSLKQQKDNLLAQNDHLLRQLEMQLNRYRTEFMNVLKNDSVKAMVVQPQWPNRHDLMDYYNLF